ncbi:MAG: phosphodiester glycosidase family protein [Saprospiraceae bacterium]
MKNYLINFSRNRFSFFVCCSLLVVLLLCLWLVFKTNERENGIDEVGNENVSSNPHRLAKLEDVSEKGVINIKVFDQEFAAFIFDISQDEINFFYQNIDGEKYRTFSNLAQQLARDSISLRFAMNAGIFDAHKKPEGLFLTKKDTISPLNLQDGFGNFYLKPNGVFYLTTEGRLGVLESEEFANTKIEALYATQSGPMLLRDGVIHPAFNAGSKNLFVRNGVGILSPQQAVFLISKAPVNFFDFASVFQTYFNCENALYLDGAISEIYFPSMEEKNKHGSFSGIIGVVD